MPTLSISLTDSNYTGLVSLAKEKGINRSKIANKALELYIQEIKLENEDILTAEKAWKKFEESGEQTFSLSEVKKELGL